MIIRRLRKSEVEEFIEFNKKAYPERKGFRESVEFKLRCPDSVDKGGEYRTIITSEKESDKIIGQLQLLPCTVFIKGKATYAEWGMDFMVDPDYRGKSFGVGMVKEALKTNHLGMGFAPKALRIHSYLGINLIGYFWKFISFRTPFTLLRFLVGRLIKVRKNEIDLGQIVSNLPEAVEVEGCNFKLTKDYSLFKKKVWNNEIIEFNRDKRFMEWRFGSFPNVFKTYVETDGGALKSFFVLRAVKWKGFPFLMLVDYRFNEGGFEKVVKAAKKILKGTKVYGLITISSFNECDKVLKRTGFMRFGKPGHITSNADFGIEEEHIKKRDMLFVTGGDSDIDFFYGVKEWYEC